MSGSGIEVTRQSAPKLNTHWDHWDNSVLAPKDTTTEWKHQYWHQAANRISNALKEKVSAFHSSTQTANSKTNIESVYGEAHTKLKTLLNASTIVTDIEQEFPRDFDLGWETLSESDFSRESKLTLIKWLCPSNKNKKDWHQDAKTMMQDYSRRMVAAPEYLKFTPDEESRLLSTLPDIKHSEKTYDNNKASFEALASNNQSLQKERNMLGRDLEETRTQFSKLQQKHTQLQEELEKEKTEAARKEESHKRQMQKICEEHSKELRSIAAVNDELQTQLPALLQSFEQLQQTKQELVGGLQAANVEGDSLLAVITLAKHQSEATRQKLEEMDIAHKLSLKNKDQEIIQLKSKVEEQNRKICELTKQARNSLTLLHSQFKAEEDTTHHYDDKVLKENKELKAKVTKLEDQLKQSQLNNSKTATQPVPKTRLKTTDETAKLSAEVKRLEDENKQLKAQIQTSSQLDVSASSMNANIEQVWVQIEKENKEYKNKVKALETQNKEYKEKVKALETRNKEYKDKVKALETSLAESQKYASEMLENFQKRIEQLEKENKNLEDSSNSTPKEILKERSDSASKEALALSKYPTVPDDSRIPEDAKPNLSNLLNYASELTDKERSFELNWENLANVLNAKTGSNINHRKIAFNIRADYGGLSTFLTEWSEQDKATNLILAQSLFDCLEAKHRELADEFYINICTGKGRLRST